jgi:hypothetical protein
MKFLYKISGSFLFFAALASCKKPYIPPVINSPGNYLVVEGVINTGSDSTIIKLSRTVNIANGVTTNPVTGAAITVQSDQNTSYPLTETVKGNYASAGLNLDNSHKYRLSIKTATNQQYVSDFVAVSVTPPIDSIGFTTTNNAMQVYVNTHDAHNNTHYYRWEYAETWAFSAEFTSLYVTDGKELLVRRPDQLIHDCWASANSSTILLGSSAKLSQDIIYHGALTSIASTSEKIETKYSMLLHQYALSADAYTFWTNLKKNTEQLGSIFDAQPSEIKGNIHNAANPAEPVIGYVSACNVQTKRIFISNSQLPQTWIVSYPYQCTMDSVYASAPKTGENFVKEELIPIPPSELTLYPFNSPTSVGYLGTTSFCADCTLRGTKVKPSFWE